VSGWLVGAGQEVAVEHRQLAKVLVEVEAALVGMRSQFLARLLLVHPRP
jgi:hypothetical protein